MEVSEIMSTDLGVCRMDETIRVAAQRMEECDCGAIPVVENDESLRLMGLITDRDIAIRAVAKGLDVNTTRVSECMSTDITWVHPESQLQEVERIMENLQVRRVPVVDENRCLCGMVSVADVALSRSPQQAGEVVQEVSRPSGEAKDAAFLS
jgi:CBS domain-containing protein